MKLKSVKSDYQKGQIGRYIGIGFSVRVRADSKTENQIRHQKHDLDRQFIHKSVGKCDIIMQNCRLITPPHLSFGRPEQNKKRKTILQMLLHHFRR